MQSSKTGNTFLAASIGIPSGLSFTHRLGRRGHKICSYGGSKTRPNRREASAATR